MIIANDMSNKEVPLYSDARNNQVSLSAPVEQRQQAFEERYSHSQLEARQVNEQAGTQVETTTYTAYRIPYNSQGKGPQSSEVARFLLDAAQAGFTQWGSIAPVRQQGSEINYDLVCVLSKKSGPTSFSS